jgi:hypothetical protein
MDDDYELDAIDVHGLDAAQLDAKYVAAGMHPVQLRCRGGVGVEVHAYIPGCKVVGSALEVMDALDVSVENAEAVARIQEDRVVGRSKMQVHTPYADLPHHYGVRTLADMKVMLELCERLNDARTADAFIAYVGRLAHLGFYTATDIIQAFGIDNVRVCREVLPPDVQRLLPAACGQDVLTFAAAAADLHHAQTWMGAIKQALRRNKRTVILGWERHDSWSGKPWGAWMITSREAPDGFRLAMHDDIFDSLPPEYGLWPSGYCLLDCSFEGGSVLPKDPATWESYDWELNWYGIDVDDRLMDNNLGKPPTLVVEFGRPTPKVIYHDPDPASPWADIWDGRWTTSPGNSGRLTPGPR